MDYNQMKHDIRYTCRVMLLSFATLYSVEYLLGKVFSYAYLMQNPQSGSEEMYQMLFQSGTLMLLSEGSAALVACVLLLRVRKLNLFAEKREADFSHMIKFFFCLMGLQLLSSSFVMLLESGLNLVGYSLIGAFAAASGGTLSPSMLAYSVLFAPILEELIFRGVVLHFLQPYGKRFAILFAALLFGLMHANIVQLPVAILAGILLGYVAIEYSLPAAMVVHSLCNVSVEAGSLMTTFGIPGAEMIDMLVVYLGLFVLAGAVVKYKMQISQYVKEQRGVPGCVKAVITSVSFWVMTIAMLILTVLSVTPLQ